MNRPTSDRTNRLAGLLPPLEWLRGYTRSDFSSDTVAGVVTAFLQIPQAMAYAVLAGLPPQIGLYASVAAPIAYGVFASSRTLAVGPVAVAAIMIAHTLAAPEVQGHGTAVGNALVLALECGVILLLMAALRFGAMVNFLSHPMLTGFTSGAALLILLTQLPPLLGVAAGHATTASDLAAGIYRNLDSFQPSTLILGGASLVVLLAATGPLQVALRKWSGERLALIAGRAAPLFVVALATALVAAFNLDRVHGVATVGPIPPGLPHPDLGFLRLGTWVRLLPSAALIALISYVSGFSVAKVLASRRRQRISANQELAALGVANVAAAFTGGMPVGASFSRTMVSFAAGARTQLATVVASAAIWLTLLFFAPWFARLPNAALAAIIVVAVIPLIEARKIAALWRYERSDAAVLFVTFCSVLLLGLEVGLVTGLLISLFAYVWRTSRPHVAIIGRIPNTEHFRNVTRHDVETWPTLAFVRVDESLTFANIGLVEDRVLSHLAGHPDVKHVILVCSAINHIDSSALDALEALMTNLHEAGVTVHLAEVKGPLFDALKRAGLTERMPGLFFFRTNDAVEGLLGPNLTDKHETAPH